MNVVSQKLRRPIINWLIKSEVSKKELAEALGVSRQTPTDWTKENPSNLTAENAVRLAEYANDTELTMNIIYKFFGIFRPMDGNVYRSDLSASDDLRELEESERDEAKAIAQRVLLKRVQKLSNDDFSLLLKFSKEQAEAVFANIQYLNALCEIQNLSIMDLFDTFMTDWQKAGYFGGD